MALNRNYRVDLPEASDKEDKEEEMAKASASGVSFFIFIVIVGPVFYAARHFFRVRTGYYDRRDRAAKEIAMGSISRPPAGVAGAEAADTEIDDIPAAGGDTDSSASTVGERDEVPFWEYLISLVGYAVGIGNVWRFPYLVGKYGGFAFIIAYLFCLFLCSLPFYLMELGMGQHVKLSVIETFYKIRPRWWPLGLAQILGESVVVVSYYNVLLAYSLFYMARSCEDPLPWHGNAQEFWIKDVLRAPDVSEGTDLGRVSGPLAGCLLAIYFIIFLAVGFGKDILAQFTWITVVLPVFMVAILLVKAVTLEGASDGIDYYINKLEWDKLLSGELWAAAAGQILFSLSPGTGCAITLTSHAKKNTDVYRVALIVAVCNSSFSLFAGFAIFSVLGNLAYNLGKPVAEIAESSGIGLAFIAIADGMTNFGEASNVMSVLFFAMLLMLGFDSSFAWVEASMGVLDDFLRSPTHGLGIRVPRIYLAIFLCAFLYTIGLPYCTEQGGFLLDTIDHFIGSYLLLWVCFLEAIAFAWDFGWPRFTHSIKQATLGNPATPGGRYLFPEFFWKWSMMFSAPVMAGGLLLTNLIIDIIHKYENGRISNHILTIGWVFFGSMVVLSLSNILDRRPGSLAETPGMGAVEILAESGNIAFTMEQRAKAHQNRMP